MRIIVYGAGAIGGTIGGHLARAGHDVLLVARRRHVEAIRENGLRLVTPGGTHTLHLPTATAPAELVFNPDDVVLLCVKTQDTEAALVDLRAVVADVPVFCVQNGVRNEEIALNYFPRVYGVMVSVWCMHLTPGEVMVAHEPPGLLVIGRYPSGSDAPAEAMAAALHEGGFLTHVTAEIMPYKYGKLLANLANAVSAITNAADGDPDYRLVVEAARTEAQSLLAQAGIRWVSADELRRDIPAYSQPPQGRLAVQVHGSTWQSLARGQGTVESDYLNGEIVRLAARLGARAPVNAGLARIANEMAAQGERPGRYAAVELRALLRID